MADEIIRVNSVSDIDLSKITAQDLARRYVDAQGQHYAIKYDMASHKMKVVQIVRGKPEPRRPGPLSTPPRRAPGHAVATGAPAHRPPDDDDGGILDDHETLDPNSPPPAGYNRTEMAELMQREFARARDRLKAIINQFRRSTYFEKIPDPGMKNFHADMERRIENDLLSRLDKSMELSTEIAKYPRPLNYYFNKLNDRQKSRLAAINNDDYKLDIAVAWELQESYHDTIRHCVDFIGVCQPNFAKINDTVMASLAVAQRQAYQDAVVSAEVCVAELAKLLEKITQWRKFSGNNFTKKS